MDIKIISAILLIMGGFVLLLGSLLRIFRKNLIIYFDKRLSEIKKTLQQTH